MKQVGNTEKEDKNNIIILIKSKSSGSALGPLLLGLGVGDLVDHNANTALGDDVGNTVAHLSKQERAAASKHHISEHVSTSHTHTHTHTILGALASQDKPQQESKDLETACPQAEHSFTTIFNQTYMIMSVAQTPASTSTCNASKKTSLLLELPLLRPLAAKPSKAMHKKATARR